MMGIRNGHLNRRFEVFKRDGFACVYCGGKSPTVQLELEHKKPKAQGGTDDIENLVTSCFECNRGKGDKEIEAVQKSTPGCFEPGMYVALRLKNRVASLSGYVGEVQTSDENGLRITLMDWVVGGAAGWDFYTPWENIEAALIATAAHDLEEFLSWDRDRISRAAEFAQGDGMRDAKN